MKRLWFAAKRYGYGWYPVTWEGWAVTAGYVVLLLCPTGVLPLLGHEEDSGEFLIFFFPYAVLLTALLIWISVKKGEKPGWRWGSKR